MIKRRSHRRPDSIEAYAFCNCQAALCYCTPATAQQCAHGCSSESHAHATLLTMQHILSENVRHTQNENLHRGAQRAQNMQV